jgi:hypothetical protein
MMMAPGSSPPRCRCSRGQISIGIAPAATSSARCSGSTRSRLARPRARSSSIADRCFIAPLEICYQPRPRSRWCCNVFGGCWLDSWTPPVRRDRRFSASTRRSKTVSGDGAAKGSPRARDQRLWLPLIVRSASPAGVPRRGPPRHVHRVRLARRPPTPRAGVPGRRSLRSAAWASNVDRPTAYLTDC